MGEHGAAVDRRHVRGLHVLHRQRRAELLCAARLGTCGAGGRLHRRGTAAIKCLLVLLAWPLIGTGSAGTGCLSCNPNRLASVALWMLYPLRCGCSVRASIITEG